MVGIPELPELIHKLDVNALKIGTGGNEGNSLVSQVSDVIGKERKELRLHLLGHCQ